MKTNEELAREASNSEGSNATPDLFGLSQIDRFATLVEQRLLAKLLEGVGEPVAWCEEDGMHYRHDLLINEGLHLYTADQVAAAVLAERGRICKAIKEADDRCVTEGDYMLDSDDCIVVARGTWVQPDYSVATILGATT